MKKYSGSTKSYPDTDAAAAAGAAAEAAAGAAAASSAASAVCTYYVVIGGALRAPLYVHDELHSAEAAEAEAAAETELGKHVVHSRTSRTFGKSSTVDNMF